MQGIFYNSNSNVYSEQANTFLFNFKQLLQLLRAVDSSISGNGRYINVIILVRVTTEKGN